MGRHSDLWDGDGRHPVHSSYSRGVRAGRQRSVEAPGKSERWGTQQSIWVSPEVAWGPSAHMRGSLAGLGALAVHGVPT